MGGMATMQDRFDEIEGAGGKAVAGKVGSTLGDSTKVTVFVYGAVGADGSRREEVGTLLVERMGEPDEVAAWVDRAPSLLVVPVGSDLGTDAQILAATGIEKWIEVRVRRGDGIAYVNGTIPDGTGLAVPSNWTVIKDKRGDLEAYEVKPLEAKGL
jgi:hypothetical protein